MAAFFSRLVWYGLALCSHVIDNSAFYEQYNENCTWIWAIRKIPTKQFRFTNKNQARILKMEDIVAKTHHWIIIRNQPAIGLMFLSIYCTIFFRLHRFLSVFRHWAKQNDRQANVFLKHTCRWIEPIKAFDLFCLVSIVFGFYFGSE